MSEQPMTADERLLLAHRWAVRVNFPTDLGHAAQLARRAVGVARYGSLAVPAEVEAAVEVLGRWAVQVAGQVEAERAELARTGLDDASFQQRLERGQ